MDHRHGTAFRGVRELVVASDNMCLLPPIFLQSFYDRSAIGLRIVRTIHIESSERYALKLLLNPLRIPVFDSSVHWVHFWGKLSFFLKDSDFTSYPGFYLRGQSVFSIEFA